MKTTTNRYRYNSKEQLTEVEAIDYGARQYSTELCHWLQVDPLAEKYKSLSSYNFCANNPLKFVDVDGKQPVKYIDSNGQKHISWSVVVMVQAPKAGVSERRIERHERKKQTIIDNLSNQFNHYLNGDGNGAENSDGELVLSSFDIRVEDVIDPQSNKEARKLSVQYEQEIKEGQGGGKHGRAAVFMKGGTRGALGLTRESVLITIAPDAPMGAESHELFHSTGIPDNGYDKGGVLNSPPQPINSQEVDQMWDIIPERK